MTRHRLIFLTCWAAAGAVPTEPTSAEEPARPRRPDPVAVQRGRAALLEQSFLEPEWSDAAYAGVARFWDEPAPDLESEPDAFAEAFRDRYGLHEAPYSNDGLPMGLKRSIDPENGRAGFQVDCLICHGGSIGGTSYVGLGNSQLDLIGLYRDLFAADDRPLYFTGFTVNTVRGAVNAGQMSAVLLSLRNPDLSERVLPLPLGSRFPETDVPAWWLLKHKETMYYDGRTPAASVRSIMQFLMGETSRSEFEELEPTFGDIQAYLFSLQPPPYPRAIDPELAERGRALFEDTCSRCHGTYRPERSYPNRIVELNVIGTDPARALAPSDRLVAHYNASWFGERYPADETMTGYQAPPLDGIWATAPYLHNGSVPTVEALLDSSKRPDRYRRPPSTDFEHYDFNRLGWKVEVLEQDVDPSGDPPVDQDRTIYDIRRFGLGNQGHTFGDGLEPQDRRAVIEYLKTL